MLKPKVTIIEASHSCAENHLTAYESIMTNHTWQYLRMHAPLSE